MDAVATITCREMAPSDRSRWDDFVLSHPDGTFFHRSGWASVLARGFRHRPHFLLAERGRDLVGVLPLVEMKTRLFGHVFVSSPFCVQGGPLVLDQAAERALLEEAAVRMDRAGAASCELRGKVDDVIVGDTWQPMPALYDTFRKRLPGNEADALKAIPRKQRAVVRKGIEAGLEARTERSIEPFFGLYAESVHNLGTPVFSRRYVAALLDVFGDAAEILTVYDGTTPLCGVLAFSFRDEILPYYAGGGRLSRDRGGHDFMYWALMKSAIMRGLTLFDFGRSKSGTGAHKFKRNWGFEPTPLRYHVRLAPGQAMPGRNPLNPKYQRMIALWKRLPLPVANALGPHIVRGLG